MSEEIGRRVCVGSKEERIDIDRRRVLGSGAAVLLAAGSLGGLSLAGQGRAQGGRGARASDTPLQREIKAQLRGGLQKLQKQDPDGARQLATTVRIFAATIDDAPLVEVLRRANRDTLLRGAHNHAELSQLASELGINPSKLPATPTPHNREEMLTILQKPGGLVSVMHNGADALDEVALVFEKQKQQVRTVAARQQCGACVQTCEQAARAEDAMSMICAASAMAALLFPPTAEAALLACAAASASWMTFYIACAACNTFFDPSFSFC
jgi:hypothetical protein